MIGMMIGMTISYSLATTSWLRCHDKYNSFLLSTFRSILRTTIYNCNLFAECVFALSWRCLLSSRFYCCLKFRSFTFASHVGRRRPRLLPPSLARASIVIKLRGNRRFLIFVGNKKLRKNFLDRKWRARVLQLQARASRRRRRQDGWQKRWPFEKISHRKGERTSFARMRLNYWASNLPISASKSIDNFSSKSFA